MKKFGKSFFITVITTLLVLCFVFFVSAEAKEDNSDAVDEENIVYYSELFYGYSYYLVNESYFNTYNSAVNKIYDDVYNSYKNSSMIIGTGLENALDTITSPTQMVALITDSLGLTDFSYNDALDAANEEFVKYVLSDSLAYSLGESYGKAADLMSDIKDVLSCFNTLAEQEAQNVSSGEEPHTAEYFMREAFTYLKEKGEFEFVETSTFETLLEEINSSEFSLGDCFSIADAEFDFAKALMTALTLENSRIEIVDDILSTQSSGKVLYDGMTRLAKKLKNNLVKNFIGSYLKKQLADQLFDKIDDVLVEAFDGKYLKSVLKIAKMAFNGASEVAKFDDVLKWQVLTCYSNDLGDAITALAKSFSKGPFLSDEILKYEKLFVGYDAVNKAAMAATTEIATIADPFGEAYGVLLDAVENGLSTVTVTSGLSSFEISSSMTDKDFYDALALGCIVTTDGKTEVLNNSIKVSNGFSTVKVPRKANCYSSIVQGCVSENLQSIYDFNSFYGETSLYGNHINNAIATILLTPVEERQIPSEETYAEWEYSIDASIDLRNDSNTICESSVYGLNNTILGNILMEKGARVLIRKDTDITIAGNWNFFYSLTDLSILTNNGRLTINGNLKTNGETVITNNNELIIKGKIDFSDMSAWADDTSDINNYGIIRTGDCNLAAGIYNGTSSSELYVSGSFIGSSEYSNTIEGTIIFDGTKTQLVSELTSTYCIDVQNKNGLDYQSDITVKGWYKLNNNPLKVDNNTTYVYSGTKFDSSDYVHITTTSMTLSCSVKANVTLVEGSTLKIAQNSDVIIDGSVFIPYYTYRDTNLVNNGRLTISGSLKTEGESVVTNNGELIVKEKLDFSEIDTWASSSSDLINNGVIRTGEYNLSSAAYDGTSSSELYVSGNFVASSKYSNTIEGTIIFDGEAKQIVSSLNAPMVVLENASEEGVVFTSKISPSTFFNHNRNNFTLYNNGTGSYFVDYDGDGMKDNVDPYPLDPFQGENDTDFIVTFVGDKLCITEYKGSDKEVIIPETICGYKVEKVKCIKNSIVEKVYLNSSIDTVETNAFNELNSLKEITVSPDNASFVSIDGILYNKDITSLIRCPIGFEGDLAVPETVIKIEKYAFYNCSKLKSIIIPETVTNVVSYTFNNCTNLKSAHYYGDSLVIASYNSILKSVIHYCEKMTTATCLEDGVYYWYCSSCDKTISESIFEAASGHSVAEVSAQAKTCMKAGWDAYEYCTKCDYTTYIEIPASHEIITASAQAKTCTEVGWEAYEYCTECDYTTYIEIPASHEIITASAQEKTCTEAGWEAYEFCSACDYTTKVEIPATGHTEETVKGYAATCENEGLTDGVKCSVCDTVITVQNTIEKLTHKDDNGDHKCDHGCGHEFENPAEDSCDHFCHKSGFMSFIWKIVQFVWRLFKMNPVCECGVAHY